MVPRNTLMLSIPSLSIVKVNTPGSEVKACEFSIHKEPPSKAGACIKVVFL